MRQRGQCGTRRQIFRGWVGTAVLLLAACATSPPTYWYELRLDPPTVAVSDCRRNEPEVWELAPRVALPGGLDRDTLMVASGAAGLEPLAGHRWVEPLRDSIPRLLLHDLLQLRGAHSIWTAPVPAGVDPSRRLRLDVLTLLADAQRRDLRVVARWWSTDLHTPDAQPRAQDEDFTVPIEDTTIDALASAHRVALWQLAARMAGADCARETPRGIAQ